MTTSAVSQINLYGGAQNAVAGAKNGQSDSFSQIFATQAENKAEADTQAAKAEEIRKVNESSGNEYVEETESNAEANDVQEVSKEETDKIDAEKTDEILSKEDVEEVVEELLTRISEVMNVSPQDIQNALEELGMDAQELLNPENIPALVVALTEGADELSVMTNEEMFANVQEITSKVEELLAGLSAESGMSFEEIQEALAKLAQDSAMAQEDKVYTNANPSDVLSAEEVAVTLENSSLERMQDTAETGRDTRQSTADDNAQGNTNEQQMTFAQTVAERLEQTVAKTDTVVSSYTTTEAVMNQIQDAIRVIQSQDMTEMELQLHPASLGNLKVQIAAKEGVVTAVFTTENEMVRAALESQMVTLKENFAQQGIKVEAVEVTVASHAFEQNLNGDESHANEQSAPEKRRGSRRITLSDLTMDNPEEELSDEDRIVAEMMRENGNTVDYTV